MLHICYTLPIFRIKKAPIGAVACPQWGIISIDRLKTYKVVYPIRLSNLLHASVFNWDWNELTISDDVHSFTIRLNDDRLSYFNIAPSYVTSDTRWILFGTAE